MRCQADCLSATAVVQNMTRNGWGPHVVQQLYAGLGSAAAFSVVVGAIHWLTFCTAKRAALDVMVQQANEAKAKAAAEGGAGAALGAAAASSTAAPGKTHKGGSSGSQSGTAHLHVSSGHHMHDQEVRLERGAAAAAGGAAGGGAAGFDAAKKASGGGGGGHGGGLEEAPEGADVGMLASANMVGATVGAIMTALVEGPLELFRHQAQAGLISGNLFREMNNVVKKQVGRRRRRRRAATVRALGRGGEETQGRACFTTQGSRPGRNDGEEGRHART